MQEEGNLILEYLNSFTFCFHSYYLWSMVSNSPKEHSHPVDVSPKQINSNKEAEDIRSQRGTVYP